VIPEVVGKTNGKLTIDYNQLIPVLINAIKEQQAEIDDLKKQVHELSENTPILKRGQFIKNRELKRIDDSIIPVPNNLEWRRK
jgi:cell division protein FtsL